MKTVLVILGIVLGVWFFAWIIWLFVPPKIRVRIWGKLVTKINESKN